MMKELSRTNRQWPSSPTGCIPTTSIHRSLFDKSGDINVHNPWLIVILPC